MGEGKREARDGAETSDLGGRVVPCLWISTACHC